MMPLRGASDVHLRKPHPERNFGCLPDAAFIHEPPVGDDFPGGPPLRFFLPATEQMIPAAVDVAKAFDLFDEVLG
ncbi:hypothetical protein OAJ77_00675 [Rhodospirillales bacterium]|nr:hypothetical protein [Rhodospirillales bacterium]